MPHISMGISFKTPPLVELIAELRGGHPISLRRMCQELGLQSKFPRQPAKKTR
jgi:hypothetical protein